MTDPRLARRMIRRERHRSRSLAVGIALVVLMLALAYLAVEAVLEAIGATPLLLSVSAMAQAALGASAVWMLPAAAGAALVALVLLVLAIAPGRRARHRLAHERAAMIVDDDVLASALSRRAARAGGVSRAQVTTVVAPRGARIGVRPTSGFPVSSDDVRQAAQEVLTALAPTPKVGVAVAVSREGVVGA